MLTNGDELQERALKILVNEIGYHRVTMSMMLAGASWAVFASARLVTDRRGTACSSTPRPPRSCSPRR